MKEEGGKLVPISLEGLEFENDFGQSPIGLGHFSKDQGFIVVASLVGAFVGAAIAGLPLAAIVIVAGLNDINHARRTFSDKEQPLPTEQEQPAIDVEATEVDEPAKALPDAVEVEPETVSDACGGCKSDHRIPPAASVVDLPINPLAAPINPPRVNTTSGQDGLGMLQSLAVSRRSTLLIGDTGSGKSVTQSYMLTKLFELHPNAEVFVLSQKADSFCGLAQKGRVTLFDPTQPEDALFLIHSIWILYDHRRRLPESERPALSPVRLILADWLSINQALEDLKNEESVKSSKYLSKLADIIYNGRELNVCLLVDLQSYNLAAVGLKADRNSRKNFNLIGLGNYSVDELGMVNESYGVLTNLIGDRYIVADESERSALTATFKKLQPISKTNQRPIIFSGLSPARLALLPDLRKYKNSTVSAVAKQPATVIEPTDEAQQQTESSATPLPTTELKVSDSLAEPLKSIWLFAKKKNGWVTVRNIYDQKMKVLEGKKVEQIHQYLGLLADTGLGEIDEEGKSHSSVGFRAY